MAAILSRPQCVKMYRSGKGAYFIITEGEGETDQITPRLATHFLPHCPGIARAFWDGFIFASSL